MKQTDHLLIQLTIDARTFSVNVKRDKEEVYREAAKVINRKLQQYRMSFPDLSKEDYMAMGMLDFAVNLVEEHQVDQHLKDMIQKINETLE